MKVGDQFPKFELPDQDGKVWTNSDLSGNKFVLYCYPKDDTSGCTVEACEFRDTVKDFGDVKILGISPDPVKKHKKFEEKHELNFTLLADEEKSLLNELGVWVEKSMYGKKYMGVARTTFLVDADGKIEQVWEKVKPKGHAEAVKAAAFAG